MNEIEKINDQIERIWRFIFILVIIYGIIGCINVYTFETDILNLKNRVKQLEEKHEIQSTMAKK
jgi:hypothetical protein